MKINRRDFIKTGGMVMLGSLAVPSFLGSCTGNKVDQATGISFAQNHFGVSESDMKKVLAAALEKGGDYADLFFEHSYRNNIGLQDGAVNRASSNIDFGMGVRVLAGDQTGYAYVENVTLDEMLKAARTAARIATGSAGKAPVALTEEPIPNNYYGVQTPWDELAVNAKTPYLQKLNDQIFALDKRVHKVMASLGDTTSHILFCNSEGQMYYDYRPMVTLGAVCIMENNGKIENSYASRAFRMGAEFLTDDIIAEVAKEAVEKTSILFQAIKPKGGEMPVVMGAGGSGILLHEAIGHAFEADFNRKNTSIFSDQLNKKVCNEHINVVDDGTIPFNRGSVNIDDEGIAGQKTYIVKEEAADTTPSMEVSTEVMENEYFKVEYNEKGQFAKIYDKKADRDILKPGKAGNVIVSYEDRPHNYDAWDVNNYYTEKSWDIDQVSAMEVVENGPVRACVKVERKYLDSTITQFIYLYHDIPRIDIKNVIDWKEHQIFVKDYFPIDVHTNEATFDIQYGNVKRDTHDNTSWDFAKFEVCHHKWMDVSEDGYGVSMLNDCKYGVGVRNGVIGMSMLKSAIHPNPEADKELHEFTYSIYPHQGGWREAGTVKQAYQINNPLTYSWKENEGGTLAPEYSLVSSDKDNAVIEVVKKAEDSDAVIVRLYECYNRRTPVTLIFGKELTSVVECNMMEEGADPVEFTGNQATFEMKPYEIKTLKVTF